MKSYKNPIPYPTCPCRKCGKRTMECHNICEDYKNFRIILDKYNKYEKEIHDLEFIGNSPWKPLNRRR